MRFNIKCNECDRTFIAETEFYGLQRYRCPYCGHVLTCQFNAPEAKRTKARAVVPMANTTPVERHSKKELPTVKTKLIRMPSAEKIAETSRQASEKVKEGTIKTSEYLSRSSSWLAQFQEKYTDGNLWVFFGFSTLFILSVIVGLFICAEVVKVLVDGHSWLFKNYIELRNSL